MWPFTPKEKSQSSTPKETSTAEDWDLSLWLLDPERTIEELDYFAQTGQKPARLTKLTQKVLSTPEPKETFPVVNCSAKATEKEKPRADFPPNPSVGHTFLDRQSGTYYMWSGKKWKVLANTPPQKPSLLESKSADEWFDRLYEERYFNIVTRSLNRPFFSNKLEEKQWCAKIASAVLKCEIKVYESLGTGLVILNGQEIRHPIENWDWHGKTTEEFFEHLYRLWVKHTQVMKHD